MAKSNYRVVLTRNTDFLLTLAQDIIAKHTADDAASFLTVFDMADFSTKISEAVTQNEAIKALRLQSEAATENRNLLLGIKAGQSTTTPGSLLYYLTSIKNILRGLYRGQERTLGNWGFTVNASTNTKRVRTPISHNAEKVLELAQAINKKHLADGASSPLNGLDMADFASKISIAIGLHDQVRIIRRNTETATQDLKQLVGIAKNQTSLTLQTILYTISGIRYFLAGHFRGNEQRLGGWGFTVNTSLPPTKPDEKGEDEPPVV